MSAQHNNNNSVRSSILRTVSDDIQVAVNPLSLLQQEGQLLALIPSRGLATNHMVTLQDNSSTGKTETEATSKARIKVFTCHIF